jgi:hypothetical protein
MSDKDLGVTQIRADGDPCDGDELAFESALAEGEAT